MQEVKKEFDIGLPDLNFLLVHTGKTYKIINLDSYGSPELVSKKYIDMINTYGRSKVRYCKVVPSTIKTTVSFES
jgi:hypothetical protein